MLTVTNRARSRLAQMLDNVRAPAGTVARFVIKRGDRIALRRGSLEPGDATFDYEGRVVLVLDEAAVHAMGSQILDVFDAEDGPRLRLQVFSVL